MRKWLTNIIIMLFMAGCNNKAVDKPKWVNNADSISFPSDSLVFKAKGRNWKASLQSFTQPVPLTIKYTDDGFILSAQNYYGITGGTAQLIVINGSKNFYYDLNLRNSSFGIISEKDYRSPKTVNPDSSLVQQRILHRIDEWRNILHRLEDPDFFYEDILQLHPIAGTYHAQKDKALSSFYVQPGSAVSIEVKANYIKEEHVYVVTAGPLKDKYNNMAANGTMVAFTYNDEEQTYRMEAALLNGFAEIKIPVEKNKLYQLTAKVNETTSKPIQLLP